jgi:hypothetical protein
MSSTSDRNKSTEQGRPSIAKATRAVSHKQRAAGSAQATRQNKVPGRSSAKRRKRFFQDAPRQLCAFDLDLPSELFFCPDFPDQAQAAPIPDRPSNLTFAPSISLEEWLFQRGYCRQTKAGYLGLFVNKDSRQIWRWREYPGGDPRIARFDFSGSEGMWYCFLRIYESGEKGVLASELRDGYPLKKNSYRQTVYDMSQRIALLGIKIEEGAGRNRCWRLVDNPPPPESPRFRLT